MSDELDLKRIQKREQRGEGGAWKWQLLDALERQERLLEAMAAEIRGMNDTRRKLSEAGKKSAAVRKEKLGTAVPVNSVPFQKKAPRTLREQVKVTSREQVEMDTACSVEKIPEVKLWDVYYEVFVARHRDKPIRNVTVNSQLKNLENLVGRDIARDLVRYYLTRSDAYYLHAKHPVGLLLRDAQKLKVEMNTGTAQNMRDARRVELGDHNERVAEQYLRRCEQQKTVKEVNDAEA